MQDDDPLLGIETCIPKKASLLSFGLSGPMCGHGYPNS